MLCGNHCADLTYMPLEANCGMILGERNIKSTSLLFVIWSYLDTSRETGIPFVEKNRLYGSGLH